MKNPLKLLCLVPLAALAISYPNISQPELDARIAAPSTNYNFTPWDACGNYYGAYGTANSGVTLGESNRPTAVYPIGPWAALVSLHVDGVDFEGNAISSITFQNDTYPIRQKYNLHSDLLLCVITNTVTHTNGFPYWNAVWRGYSDTTNTVITTNFFFVPGFGLLPFGTTTNEYVTPLNLTNYAAFAISGGPYGNAICAIPTGGQVRSWSRATNTYATAARWTTLSNAYSGGTYNPTYIFTEAFNIEYYPAGNGNVNFGTMTGDSGGSMWIRDGGQWWLVGLMNSGGNCVGSVTVGAIAWQAAYFRQEYWNAVGEPGELANALDIRSMYFATNANYAACSGYTSQTNQPPVTPPTPPTPPPDLPPPPYVPPVIDVPSGDDAMLRRKLDTILLELSALRKEVRELKLLVRPPATNFAMTNIGLPKG